MYDVEKLSAHKMLSTLDLLVLPAFILIQTPLWINKGCQFKLRSIFHIVLKFYTFLV